MEIVLILTNLVLIGLIIVVLFRKNKEKVITKVIETPKNELNEEEKKKLEEKQKSFNNLMEYDYEIAIKRK